VDVSLFGTSRPAALMQLLAEHDAVVVSLYRVGCAADSAVEGTTTTPSAEPG
jgi:hypothetical protein